MEITHVSKQSLSTLRECLMQNNAAHIMAALADFFIILWTAKLVSFPFSFFFKELGKIVIVKGNTESQIV